MIREQRQHNAEPCPAVMRRTSVQLDTRMSFAAWRSIGAQIGARVNASAWWIGDWMAFGQSKYGRPYKEAAAATGLDYKTLRNYAVVARRFDVSRRRDTLTFQHHAEVCAMDDSYQERWLDLAAAHQWSRGELRRRIRVARAGTAAVASAAVLRVPAEPDRIARWRAAALAADAEFDAWVSDVLDAAAGDVSAVRPATPAARLGSRRRG
jgi:hypothetical protein